LLSSFIACDLVAVRGNGFGTEIDEICETDLTRIHRLLSFVTFAELLDICYFSHFWLHMESN